MHRGRHMMRTCIKIFLERTFLSLGFLSSLSQTSVNTVSSPASLLLMQQQQHAIKGKNKVVGLVYHECSDLPSLPPIFLCSACDAWRKRAHDKGYKNPKERFFERPVSVPQSKGRETSNQG
jgi:hypothetical protein